MLLTIITCCKDDYVSLERTIESYSVLKKYTENVEIKVWDASSSPKDIRKIIPEVNNLRNLTIDSVADRGLYDGINQAIGLANGEYIAIINSGDRLLHGFEEILNEIVFRSINGGEAPDIYANPVMTWKNKIISPSPDFSAFIHQGFVYKKNLHYKYGEYLFSSGFTAADYLFFFGQIDLDLVSKCFGSTPIAFYQRPGLSSSFIHFLQRDIILGSKMKKSALWFAAKFTHTIVRFYLSSIYNKVFYR
jgi:hypothetical protein